MALSNSNGEFKDDESVKSSSVSVGVNESKDQMREINKLREDKEQKITAINRLKFQLNELRSAAEESESKRLDAEKKLEKLIEESEKMKSENSNQYEQLQAKFRYVFIL